MKGSAVFSGSPQENLNNGTFQQVSPSGVLTSRLQKSSHQCYGTKACDLVHSPGGRRKRSGRDPLRPAPGLNTMSSAAPAPCEDGWAVPLTPPQARLHPQKCTGPTKPALHASFLIRKKPWGSTDPNKDRDHARTLAWARKARVGSWKHSCPRGPLPANVRCTCHRKVCFWD